ncbi:hypothetical protein L1887_16006 [Cichorium endivia]|nr:hypothetical protein L1887_16006 [Cichorium endivia]
MNRRWCSESKLIAHFIRAKNETTYLNPGRAQGFPRLNYHPSGSLTRNSSVLILTPVICSGRQPVKSSLSSVFTACNEIRSIYQFNFLGFSVNMYPSRGNNAYGQQPQQSYSGQSAYGQNLGPDGVPSQMPMASRHSTMLSGHPSTATHYGGQYASVYGSMALSSALEAPGANARESGTSGDYSVLSQKYGQKEVSEYSPGDRLQHVDRAGVYAARNLQNEPTARFGDSVAFGHHQHQADMYSRLDAASSLRKELLQAQTLQSASIEGSSRQADYLATKAATTHQHLLSNSGRIDDVSHHKQHPSSILGAAPLRNTNNLVHAKTSGYGVSLPPGRDYGKSLHSTPPQGAYVARANDHKDNNRQGYNRQLDRRAEELRREVLREREKERVKERDRKTKQRASPRIEASSSSSLHRRRSPIKEKQRDYVCKVNSSGLLDVERDYVFIDKRYPRLFTSPECSKVIVNWSRENLKIPLDVPVSFEHDFVKGDLETNTTNDDDPEKLEHGNTQWNAKILLMSGVSQNALEELSSERDYKYEDRIPHFCNMIRFACLKNGNTLKAIGGLWDTIDGIDPSIDKSTLIQTALRHAKNLTGLDLNNCQHWNPFLEIHYDRVRKDGIFSHKEVTVLFVPDLSDCLPSLDSWRDQWLAHKNKDFKKDAKPEKMEVSESAESASKLTEKSKDKVKEPEKEPDQVNPVIEKKNGVEIDVETTGSGKKKIIKKVIKKKVVKKGKAENTAKQIDTLDSKKAGETITDTEANQGQSQSQGQESTGDTPVVKTITKKKVIKKVPLVKCVKKEDEGTQLPDNEQESFENKPKSEDTESTSVKKTVKKKIIKRVVKKKIVNKDANEDNVADKSEVIIEEQKKDESGVDENEKNDENKKEEQNGKLDSGSSETKGILVQSENNEKLEVEEKSKEVKVKKENDDQDEIKGKYVKDGKKEEEVPRHPGLFLQTKESNKFRSLSFSLDSLLDYDDNDIEESTFELSLFAETFYEMLQYQMGSRILSFLQKLRIKFVDKRNQKKRQLEETSEKEKVKTSIKRAKTDLEIKSVDNEEDEKVNPKVENIIENTKSDEDVEEDEDMTDAIDVKSKNIVKNEEKEDLKKKENINKELLQAFRFFDRNRVGHIRVEDMRSIIHNLGNFLSHREVKELVQSALLESNTGRDDRILYNKLVRMSDI